MKTNLFSRYPTYVTWCKIPGMERLEIGTVIIDDIFEHRTGYDMFEVKISFYMSDRYDGPLWDFSRKSIIIHSYYETHIKAGEDE